MGFSTIRDLTDHVIDRLQLEPFTRSQVEQSVRANMPRGVGYEALTDAQTDAIMRGVWSELAGDPWPFGDERFCDDCGDRMDGPTCESAVCAASRAGALLGSRTSPAKAAAARANGRLGGRPPAKIRGAAAIGLAEVLGVTLHKYADPTEGARTVSLSEARAVAAEDPGLIYCLRSEAVEAMHDGLRERLHGAQDWPDEEAFAEAYVEQVRGARRYHVTAIRNGGAHGHRATGCSEGGCAGDEVYLTGTTPADVEVHHVYEIAPNGVVLAEIE